VAVALVDGGDLLVGAVQPAREVAADSDLDLGRRRRAEVRVERDQPLDLVQRPARLAREPDQLLAREPAVLVLDRVQRRDQARTREPAGARFPAGDAAVRDRHQWAPADPFPLAAGSIRTAQNLNSGIFPNGSISSMVSRFAAASRKWNAMKTLPRASLCDTLTASSIDPRRELTRAIAPSVRPHSAASLGCM